jgi:hypothetical protein
MAELQKRCAHLHSVLNNELSERIEVQKRLKEQQSYNVELVEKFEGIRSDHSALMNNLTELFNCVPTISSIIAAAAVAARTSQQVQDMQKLLQMKDMELAKARVLPVKLQACLHIEQKRTRLYEARMKLDPSPVVMQQAVLFECATQFLNCVMNGTGESVIRAMCRFLLDRLKSGDYGDCQIWTNFAGALVACTRVGLKAMSVLEGLFPRLAEAEAKVVVLREKADRARLRRANKVSSISKTMYGTLYERSLKQKTPTTGRSPMTTFNRERESIPKHIPVHLPRRSTPSGVVPPPVNSLL